MSADPFPSRAVVRRVIEAVLTGERSPESAADWAGRWLADDSVRVDDPVVWNAVAQLAGADLRTGPDDYLHGDADFHRWLDALQDDDGAQDDPVEDGHDA